MLARFEQGALYSLAAERETAEMDKLRIYEGAPNEAIKALRPHLLDYSHLIEIERTGVYIHLSEGHVSYVGQAKDILNRTYQHLRSPPAPFDELLFWPCAEEDLNSHEMAMISALAPLKNRALRGEALSEIGRIKFYYMTRGLSGFQPNDRGSRDAL